MFFIDVGGGSTELSLIKKGIKTASKSFKIGSVRNANEIGSEEIKLKIKQWLIQNISSDERIKALGTGGNINKLYNLADHNFQAPLTYNNLNKVLELLKSYNYEERIRILKLKPDRADVIIPSGNIYKLIMETTNADEIIVPKVGLSDGIIYNLFLKKELLKVK
jgi:exopolyphosphatase/guanosine-5'-triphosphate,3'-diphosphate pyrophosphatase